MASSRPTLVPGQSLSLHVERPAAGGRMIARAEGRIVFVAGAIPGERVTARVTRVAKGVVFADTVAADNPSPDRRESLTDPGCGGSVYAHIAYPRQLDLKAEVIADGLQRIGRVTLPAPVRVAASNPDGYRMRARLHVLDGRIGFFREGSHTLCDVRATRQLLEPACDALDRLSAALRAGRLEAVREIELAENVDASARVVHLDAAAPVTPDQLDAVRGVPGLTGITLTSPGPAGRPDPHLVSGDPAVVDRLSVLGHAVTLRRHARAFFQGNRYLLGDLLTLVCGELSPGQRVVDLYAGVGVFAAAAAVSRSATVVAVEGDAEAARDLEVNAAAATAASGGTSGRTGGAVEVMHQSVEQFLGRRRPVPDAVILDPPRTGLSPGALAGLVALGAPRLVYVSCDVATLARDVRQLAAAGYRIARAEAFDLFPNTAHVETVLTLER